MIAARGITILVVPTDWIALDLALPAFAAHYRLPNTDQRGIQKLNGEGNIERVRQSGALQCQAQREASDCAASVSRP